MYFYIISSFTSQCSMNILDSTHCVLILIMSSCIRCFAHQLIKGNMAIRPYGGEMNYGHNSALKPDNVRNHSLSPLSHHSYLCLRPQMAQRETLKVKVDRVRNLDEKEILQSS